MSKRANRSSGRADTQQKVDLSQLVRDLKERLVADPRFDVSALAVDVAAHNGKVSVTGWVERIRQKKWIADLAAEVVGSQNLESHLLVGPPNQRSDEDLTRAVQNALEEDRSIDSTSIQVNVVHGIVHLTGLADTTFKRRFASAIVWWILGVRDVRNDLAVIYPEPEDDELLVETIQALMEKDPLVDRTEILVISHSGLVSLYGTVGGEDAREAAESDAWIVDGVRNVSNSIEVTPGGPRAGLITGI